MEVTAFHETSRRTGAMVMAIGQFGAVAKQIGRLFGTGTVSGLDEAALLRRFVTRQDSAALEALVTRHGPMVLGVCRRVLGNSHEVDDAFQATFLVMVKKAGTIRDPSTLGPWLFGVAYRVATRARQNAAKKGQRERSGVEEIAMAASIDESSLDRDELRTMIDDEIARLPERFRRPVVLCYLQGLTHDEAASQLHCPVGTVRSRLSTARDTLRDRLSRRGVTVPAGAMAATLTAETASAAIPVVLLDTTVTAAMAFAASGMGAATVGAVSTGAASLADGVATTMMISKLKAIGAVIIAGALTLGAGGAAAIQFGGEGEGQASAPEQKETPTKVKSPQQTARADLQRQLANNEAALVKLLRQQKTIDADIKKIEVINQSYREMIGKLEGGEAIPGQTSLAPPASDQQDEGVAESPSPKAGGFGAGRGASRTMGGGEGAMMGGMVPGGSRGMAMGSGGMMMGSMGSSGGGGMTMGGFGGTGLQPASTTSAGDYVIIQAPEHRKLIASNPETGDSAVYELPAGTTGIPIVGDGIVGVMMEGNSIKELPAFANGKWVKVDLKEPASKSVSPLVGMGTIVYTIGPRVYAFSSEAGSWGVLELNDDLQPQPLVTSNRVVVSTSDKIHIFDVPQGKWNSYESGVLVDHKGHTYIYNTKADKWTDLGEGSFGGMMGGFGGAMGGMGGGFR